MLSPMFYCLLYCRIIHDDVAFLMLFVAHALSLMTSYHNFQALTVLEYLVANGSERVIDDIREHSYQIQVT